MESKCAGRWVRPLLIVSLALVVLGGQTARSGAMDSTAQSTRGLVSLGDGTIAVNDSKAKKNEIVAIDVMARKIISALGSLDRMTDRIYLPAAKFGPPKAPSPCPGVLPGRFKFLVAAPAP